MSFCPFFHVLSHPIARQDCSYPSTFPGQSQGSGEDHPDPEWRAQGEEEGGKGGFPVSPVPGMVLCTGLTERGPKDPEVET